MKTITINDSSFIKQVRFDRHKRTLDISFENTELDPKLAQPWTRRRYYGVTSNDFIDLITADSVGTAYNDRIKGVYKSRKLTR